MPVVMIPAIMARRRKRKEDAEGMETSEDVPSTEFGSSPATPHHGDDGASVTTEASNLKLKWDGFAVQPPTRITFCLPHQREVFDFYRKPWVQVAVAVLICSNFIFNCAEKEWDPYTNQLRPQLWRWGEFAFNLFFLIELLVNFYGLGFAFWRYNAAWNLFDLVVVSIGCLTMAEAFAPAFLPGSLSLIRNLRAFRIFRLFKRVKSLNKIIKSLVRAIPGVFHAFLIQIIVMCIYAIIGVDLFHMKGADGEYTTYNENVLRGVCTEEEVDDGLCSLNISVSSVTARGFTYGEEYFGTFFRALYTLFQVLTGESWAEAIARPAVMGTTQAIGPALFYVSFILICQIVLINVVVAVLLDKMVEDDGTPDKAQTMADKIRELLNERHGSLEDMFRGWDTNDTGSLSKSEFRDALFSMGYNGPSEVLDRLFTSISITGEIPFADLDRLVSMPTPRPKGSVKDEVFALRDELKSDLARIEADLACHRQWLEKQLLCMLNEVRADREPGVRPTTIHVGSAPPIPRSHGL